MEFLNCLNLKMREIRFLRQVTSYQSIRRNITEVILRNVIPVVRVENIYDKG